MMRKVPRRERHLHEECGVFGLFSPETADVASLAYYGLFALQHRGQESAGIAVNDDGVFSVWRGVGLAGEALPRQRLQSLGAGPNRCGTCPLRHHRLRCRPERPAPDDQSLQGPHGPCPTTGTSPTPWNCAGCWRSRAPFSTPPRIPKSSPTFWFGNGCARRPLRQLSALP